MGQAKTEKKYEGLSPFELKDKLIAMAQSPRSSLLTASAGLGILWSN